MLGKTCVKIELIIFLVLFFVNCFGVVSKVNAQNTPAKPNIINIVVDDMGFSDIGSYGGEIETPNIDSLAASGIRYSKYRTYPQCIPTRNAILTGMDAPPLRKPSDSMTLAEALKTAGYSTYFIGKTNGGVLPHMVDVPKRGFDRSFGNTNGGNYWTCSDKGTKCFLDGKEWNAKEPFFKTDAETDFALEFLDANPGDTPFFLHLAYHAPHSPLQAKPVDIEKYKGKYMEGPAILRKRRYERLLQMGMIDGKWPLSTGVSESEWSELSHQDKLHYDNIMATYAAMIDNVDQNIGRLLAKLKTMGVSENTIIFFSSDNGASDAEGQGLWPGHIDKSWGRDYNRMAEVGSVSSHWQTGRAWANLSNTPFRLYKNDSHEGGLSAPLIVNFPTRLKTPGSINHEQVSVFDIMPTAMKLAEAEYPSEFEGRTLKPMRGIDLSPSFHDQPLPKNRPLFFFWDKSTAFIHGEWKIVSTSGRNFDPKKYELYNLENDRTEMNDLSESNPERLHDMVDAAREYVAGLRAEF